MVRRIRWIEMAIPLLSLGACTAIFDIPEVVTQKSESNSAGAGGAGGQASSAESASASNASGTTSSGLSSQAASSSSSSSGSAPCAVPGDCPGVLKPCERKVCTDGVCGIEPIAAGSAANSQFYGDCQIKLCDANGNIGYGSDIIDSYDDGSDCTIDYCDMSVTMHDTVAAGTPCGKGVCDSDGHCVECMLNNHCVSPNICVSNRCVAPHCTNALLDGDETQKDCGGSCLPCGTGAACAIAADCQSGVCNGLCGAPACPDGVHNGTETDVDCGGPGCPSCGAGQECVGPSDCISGVCIAAKCVAPTCSDSVKNSNETGIDCGGSCAPCP